MLKERAMSIQAATTRLVGVALAVVAIDVITKITVSTSSWAAGLPGVLPVQNRGYLLGGGEQLAPALISAVLLVAVAARLVHGVRTGLVNPAHAGLIIGGCAANAGERVIRGGVTDFIATPWVVFDVGDVAIVVGLISLGVNRLRLSRQRQDTRVPVGHAVTCPSTRTLPMPPQTTSHPR